MIFRTLAARAAPPLVLAGAVLALGIPFLAGCNRASTFTLDPGEEAVVTFLESDYTTTELLAVDGIGLEGVTEADLEAVLRGELLMSWPACDYDGADNCFPFSAAGTRWIGARVSATDGTLVTGSPEGSLRDYLVVCRGPLDGETLTFVGKNDRNPAVCQDTLMCLADLEACDPVVELTGGTWICFFAVSPLCLTSAPGCSPCFDDGEDEPTGGDLRISVN